MGHRPNDAAKWDAQFKSSEDECAKDMGQMSNGAAKKDAQIQSSEEDYAQGMGQKRRSVCETWGKCQHLQL
jgi:hypothetical protein